MLEMPLTGKMLNLPSGRIEGDDTELSIRTIGRLQTEEEFDNLIIKEA
jgi:multidrug efflux pump